MTDTTFQEASAIEPFDPTSFRTSVPDGWQQGPGAFGGLVIGAITRALLASEEDPSRRLRTLTADLCAPVQTGEATIQVETLRRGGRATQLEGRCHQDGALMARVGAVLSGPRAASSARGSLEPPRFDTPWTDVPVVPVRPPMGPRFARHYEFRPLEGLPFAGGAVARSNGYLRQADLSPEPLDAPAVAALLDAWWPAAFVVEAAPRPMTTASFSMQLLIDPREVPGDAPLSLRIESAAVAEGFCVEFRELWHDDRLLALNQQTFVVLR